MYIYTHTNMYIKEYIQILFIKIQQNKKSKKKTKEFIIRSKN